PITQQLVRNVILSPEERRQVTITRKLREIILAYQLDEKLPKDDILEMYLNEVYYGNQSYGVEAAAQSYFDKHARDLDVAEAALISGLVQSPSEYDPTRRDVPRTADGIPIVTKERQAYVLEQMTRHGFITEQQARDAYAEHGEILAFNGSLDYNDESIDGQVNILTSERQPGSSIKPVIYSEAFLKGWSPATTIDDNPSCWRDTPVHQWCPVNFDNIFHGQTTI